MESSAKDGQKIVKILGLNKLQAAMLDKLKRIVLNSKHHKTSPQVRLLNTFYKDCHDLTTETIVLAYTNGVSQVFSSPIKVNCAFTF